MTPEQNAEKIRECLAVLTDTYAPPVTPRDVAEHRRLVAREMHRAELRRKPVGQLDLEDRNA